MESKGSQAARNGKKPLTATEVAVAEKEAKRLAEKEDKKIRGRFNVQEEAQRKLGKRPQFALVDPAHENIVKVAHARGYGVIHKPGIGLNIELLESPPDGAVVEKNPDAAPPAEKKRGHGGPPKTFKKVTRVAGGIPISYAQFIAPVPLERNNPGSAVRSIIAGVPKLGRVKANIGMALQGGHLRLRLCEDGKPDVAILVPITNIAAMYEMPEEFVPDIDEEVEKPEGGGP